MRFNCCQTVVLNPTAGPNFKCNGSQPALKNEYLKVHEKNSSIFKKTHVPRHMGHDVIYLPPLDPQ